MREWYRKNREAILARQRVRRAANPEAYREASRRWRAANREKDRGYCAAWARRNPAACVRRVRRWQLANPERYAAQQRATRARAKARKSGGQQISLGL